VQVAASLDSLKAAAAEIVTEDELRSLVQRAGAGKKPRAYIGFEPSGTAHVGWMVCTDMVRRLVEAGFEVTILLADWHAQINDKLGGDLRSIRLCGEYMMEAFEALGVPREGVSYRWASEAARDDAYWATVVAVLKHTTLARMRRAMTIMGRAEDEADGDMSKFLYPAMQVADIFYMGIDLAYGGLDQRHAHMLAREIAPKMGRTPPVAIHTPLVPSLREQKGRMDATAASAAWVAGGSQATRAPWSALDQKMSKSDPDSGIFIHDSTDDVKRKLKGAHCPAKEVEGNPVLDLLRLVVWPRLAELHADGPARFTISRPPKFGGDKIYVGYEALLAEYKQGLLHPLDLKNGVADAINTLLEPVRAHFKAHPDKLAFVQQAKRTR
jgi:tyrosyl-tRNA synthetase